MPTAQTNPSSSEWSRYRPGESVPWNLRRVVHLHRRAGFAATWGEIQRDLRDGPDVAIDRVMKGTARIGGTPANFEELAGKIGDAAVISNDPDRLKAWWLFRMLFSPDALAERLALMWHNHFATSNFKVRDLAMMRGQNERFRSLGRAKFGKLLDEMLHDPALLVWLDASSNRKGQANENLSRELMELFTLGVGNFTEQDVKEAARALTGGSVTDGAFRERLQWHDDGEKVILGVRGNLGGAEFHRILVENPATAHRLAWRICSTFMGENVAGDAAVSELAAGLVQHDLDIGWAVETVLRSSLFFSDANMGSRICGPIEFIVGACQALQFFDPPPSTLLLAEWARRLGMDLFYPPNVGGWTQGRAWLTTRTILARANFAAALVSGELNLAGATPNLRAMATEAKRSEGLAEMLGFFNDLLTGGRVSQQSLAAILERAKAPDSPPDGLGKAVALLLCEPEVQLS